MRTSAPLTASPESRTLPDNLNVPAGVTTTSPFVAVRPVKTAVKVASPTSWPVAIPALVIVSTELRLVRQLEDLVTSSLEPSEYRAVAVNGASWPGATVSGPLTLTVWSIFGGGLLLGPVGGGGTLSSHATRMPTSTI